MREQIFLFFICLFGLKSLLTKQKLNLHSGFLIGQYNFTQHILFMILKFENHDKTSSKTKKILASITSMGDKNEWQIIN